jgi:hypothetical protein
VGLRDPGERDPGLELSAISPSERPRERSCHVSSSCPEIRLRSHLAVMRGSGWALKEEVPDLRGDAGYSRTVARKACILIMTHHPRAPGARLRKDPSGNGCSAGPGRSGKTAARTAIRVHRSPCTLPEEKDGWSTRRLGAVNRRLAFRASADRRGPYPRGEPYRVQNVARPATPATTRATTAQFGVPHGFKRRRVRYSCRWTG